MSSTAKHIRISKTARPRTGRELDAFTNSGSASISSIEGGSSSSGGGVTNHADLKGIVSSSESYLSTEKAIHLTASMMDEIKADVEKGKKITYKDGYLLYNNAKIRAGYADEARDLSTDSPVYNRFLRKDIPDTAKEKITFEKGIQVSGGVLADALEVRGLAKAVNLEVSERSRTRDLVVTRLAEILQLSVTDVATLAKVIVKEFISSEKFIPGFDGEGMKIWKLASGDWEGEIDTLTIRKSLKAFELIIQKIRAVNGGLVISQANGKIAVIKDLGEIYHIGFEDDLMFYPGDLIRCQTWKKTGSKYYWVTVNGFDTVNGLINVSKAEFNGVVPEIGDEVVQMGNVNTVSRQSLIYLSAAEDGRPVIDILSGVNSKSFTGKIKTRLGCLDGITDTDFPSDMQPSGYGLYCANGFFKGSFILRSGKTLENYTAEQINNIKIGGRNYLLDSAKERTSPTEYVSVDITNIVKENLGKTFTISADVKPAISGEISMYHLGNYIVGFRKSFILEANKYTRISATGTFEKTTGSPQGDICNLSFYGTYGTGRILTVKNIKIEEGNKATDWTPAPEDLEALSNQAKAAADTAQSTANTAKTNAQTANTLLADIANDNKLTPSEKQDTKKEWDIIISEKPKNDTAADKYAIAKTAYATAYNNLNSYITPLLASLTTTSNITGTDFRAKFKAYYDARTDLLNAISVKAKTLADTAQTAANNAQTAANQANQAITTIKTELSAIPGKITAAVTETKTYTDSQVNGIQVGGDNFVVNGDLRYYRTLDTLAWDKTLNGNIVSFRGWGYGYNNGVPEPTKGFHAHMNISKFGYPVFELINRNKQFGYEKRWLGVANTIDESFRKIMVPGEQYTIGMDIYSDTLNGEIHGGLHHYKVNDTTPSFYSGTYGFLAKKTNSWERFEWTFTLREDIDISKPISLYVYGYNGVESSKWFRNVSLQKGTKGSFTRSSLDLAYDTELAKTAADTAQSTANTAKTNAQTAQSTADAAKTRVEAVRTELDSRITVNANSIAQKVAKTDFDALGRRVSTAESNITTHAGLIEQRVTKTEFNNLQVGTRNYIILSKLTSHTPYNTIPTVSGTTITTKLVKASTDVNFTIAVSGYGPTVGEIYTISGIMKKNGNPVTNVMWIRKAATTYNQPSIFKVDDNTGRFEIITMYNVSGGNWLFHTTIQGNVNDIITIEKLKFEKGNKATDWTPAPEDLEAKVSTHETRIQQTENSITSHASTLNSLGTRLSSAEQKITPDAIKSTVRGEITAVDNKAIAAQTAANQAKTAADAAQATANTAQANLNKGKLYLKGTGANNPSSRQLILNNDGVNLVANNRGLCLVVIRRSDLVITSRAYYDTYNSDNSCGSLASTLNNLSSAYIVCLTSYDAIRINQTLANAIVRCGGSGFTTPDDRVPYAFVGIPGIGKGKGLEVYSGTASTDQPAEITTKIDNGMFTGSNTAIQFAESQIKQTKESIQLSISSLSSKMLYKDPDFHFGLNDIKVYNNSGGSTVTVTRVARSADCPTTSGYMLQISRTGTSTPGLGGFAFANMSRANAIFETRIKAKIPVGYTIEWASNPIGTEGSLEWLTSQAGTGRWEEYICRVTCGSSGTFGPTNYFYLKGTLANITWYVAYATVYDLYVHEDLASQINLAPGSVKIAASKIDITGAVTFNSFDQALKNTVNSKATPADIDSKINTFKGSLGGLAYEDKIGIAQLGETVIKGGYLKTELIDVDQLSVKKLNGATGSFEQLDCVDQYGNVAGYIKFNDIGEIIFNGGCFFNKRVRIDGSVDIYGKIMHSNKFLTSDLWCRNGFGAMERTMAIVTNTYMYFYPDGRSKAGVYKALSASGGVYTVPLFGMDGDANGFPVDIVLIKSTSVYTYQFQNSPGKIIHVLNANHNNRIIVKTAGNGNMEFAGGTGATMMCVNTADLYPAPASSAGFGWILLGWIGNNW
ncbi:interleukin-like EMT inducer domain-containing protein [Parabacteroides pacaensis]|uniref:interleukin-like EMT inducer domain-containing protein n=1 Tax=Parabacteroides pacaensis TaxID=2086575 RepID=UPI000D0F9DB6|nr:interleukin-like EMT inducer domain-containing protein [Parabacteroides pacaensis]